MISHNYWLDCCPRTTPLGVALAALAALGIDIILPINIAMMSDGSTNPPFVPVRLFFHLS